MNPYEVLGIKKSATTAQIKAAYRKASATAHPDKGGTAEGFRELKSAYDILSDPARRDRYDATGKTRPSPITAEKTAQLFRQIMKHVVTAIDADDPTRADIKGKMLQTLRRERGQIKDKLFVAQRKLERATRLYERFDATDDFDPVGEALRAEMNEIRDEIALHEDGMEVSEELERVLKTYEYNMDPRPEGQHDRGPMTVQVFQLGGSSSTGFG